MANPRQKRKLRSGHYRKQSRQQARTYRKKQRQKGEIVNEAIAKVWNKHKSTKHNLAAIGLVNDPNTELNARKRPETKISPDELNMDLVKKLEEQAAAYEPYQAYCSRGEVVFIQNCLQKHGTNFQAMSLDLDLNKQQHTPAQLRRKVLKYAQTLDMIGTVEKIEGEVQQRLESDPEWRKKQAERRERAEQRKKNKQAMKLKKAAAAAAKSEFLP
ncbi:hypothetical protein PTSG_02251 [Salpingoeca rosetta]|uniref:Nucleolar protein 16 n=1 Tax=Salpingoeca rosetta (strain ATCC 50818 / BSB-021) TaxID=946362 RepID=F2U1N0_SALR5|nr:uncharacterized protein PTSG_02251 [Salpingoeca rosetta]EGD81532.1 hypothetical protein PTSG_02251 [Salpingoeca rosetta]|eukprot:XP_004996736.1 hypothetical protein PTSG_02251 [Salpingoeca rosetta]